MKQYLRAGFAGLVFSVCALSLSCGPTGKYGEVNAIVDNLSSGYVKLNDDLNNAKSADDIIEAIDFFVAQTVENNKNLNALVKKYPELADGDTPELNDSLKRLKEVSANFHLPVEKIQQFSADDKVRQAVERMAEVSL